MSASNVTMAGSAAAEDATFGSGVLPQDRLVRQETALGIVRNLVPADELIGLTELAPMKPIPTDDFVIQLGDVGPSTRMAPARADDAEAELFMTDRFVPGEYRGRTIDWALKSRYSTSDINTHRDAIRTQEQLRGGTLPLFVQNVLDGFNEKVARERAQRVEALNYRLNWLCMQSFTEGAVAYNDGKIKFNVNWGRPADQHRQAPASGTYASTTHDPIGDIKAVKKFMRTRYGIELRRAYCSPAFLETFWMSEKFRLLAAPAGANIDQTDMPYLMSGWGPDSATRLVEQATGITFRPFDGIYRTRDLDSTTFVQNRWMPVDDVIFMPDEADINAIDETDLGFGKMLTSPHPAGNWSSGWYEWEKDYGQDPWSYAVGNGIKAFPVFPHMNWTYSMKVTLPA